MAVGTGTALARLTDGTGTGIRDAVAVGTGTGAADPSHGCAARTAVGEATGDAAVGRPLGPADGGPLGRADGRPLGPADGRTVATADGAAVTGRAHERTGTGVAGPPAAAAPGWVTAGPAADAGATGAAVAVPDAVPDALADAGPAGVTDTLPLAVVPAVLAAPVRSGPASVAAPEQPARAAAAAVPSTQPPSTQPPSTQPPSTRPPRTQPPRTRPDDAGAFFSVDRTRMLLVLVGQFGRRKASGTGKYVAAGEKLSRPDRNLFPPSAV